MLVFNNVIFANMKRIIVVDDDEEVLDTIQLILELGGYDVEPITNADEVFDTIKRFNPDLIILDIVLGKLDGRTINSQIKNNSSTKNIPVLMMSGLYQPGEIKLLDTPPDDFLSKPFKMDVLLEKITSLINKKKDRFHIN